MSGRIAPQLGPLLGLLVALLLVVGLPACAQTGSRAGPEPVAEMVSAQVSADAQAVEVTRHVDGDTLLVRAVGRGALPGGREVVVRLLEVDAPETWVGPECLGEQASAALARLLPVGARARVVPDREPLDRYGRHLLYVWDADGRLVNEVLVRRGLATAVLHEPNDRHIERMRAAEARARDAGRGLWGRCGRGPGSRFPDHSGTRSG